MKKTFHIANAVGVLAAPVVYVAGRLLGNPKLSSRSLDLDHHYLRGYSSQLTANEIESPAFGRFSQAARLCASAKRCVDPEMNSWFPKSHGQLLQDIVCALLHKGKRTGYFVEVGVGDGLKYSNTLMLERELGWTGILAEPAAMFHASISSSRMAALDRRAVSNETGKTLLFEQDDLTGELSGLAHARTPRGTQVLSTYSVRTVRLEDLLDEHNAPDEIDYISIDTEGSELAVLTGLDLRKRRVGFFSIEHNFDRVRLRSYDDILLPRGYRKILPQLSSFDAWYVHDEATDRIF